MKSDSLNIVYQNDAKVAGKHGDWFDDEHLANEIFKIIFRWKGCMKGIVFGNKKQLSLGMMGREEKSKCALF